MTLIVPFLNEKRANIDNVVHSAVEKSLRGKISQRQSFSPENFERMALPDNVKVCKLKV